MNPRLARRAACALLCTGPACLATIANRLAEGTERERAAILSAVPAQYERPVHSGPMYPGSFDTGFGLRAWLRPALPFVVRCATDPSTNVWREALAALHRIPPHQYSLPDLEFLLRSRNCYIRYNAVRWLSEGHSKSAEARELLARATLDDNWLVQHAAEDALKCRAPRLPIKTENSER